MAKPPTSHGSPWTRQDFAMIRKLVREGIPTVRSPRLWAALSLRCTWGQATKVISLARPKRRAS